MQSPGRSVLEAIAPDADDMHLLKPRHSAFHQTALAHLLQEADVDRLLITGIATEACVLATALDARIRDLDVVVVADCAASGSTARHAHALAVLRDCGVPLRRAAAAAAARPART